MDLARQLTHEYATKAASTSRMHPGPSITVKQLMEWLSRFMVNRGSRDLFRLTECFDKLKAGDSPSRYAQDLVALHDLFIDGIDVVKNGVLPRKKTESALLSLHGVEACLTQKGLLEVQADKITSRLK